MFLCVLVLGDWREARTRIKICNSYIVLILLFFLYGVSDASVQGQKLGTSDG